MLCSCSDPSFESDPSIEYSLLWLTHVMNLIFLDPSDEFLTQVVNIGIPKHILGFCFHVSKRGYKIGNELTRFLSRLAEPEEFQIGQVKIDDERVSDELLMSSNL